MSAQIANALKFDLGTTIGTAKIISAITNADPGVASSTAHSFTDGDFLIVSSGWERLDNRLVRVDDSTTDAFDMENVNTASTTNYPAGQGVGSAKEVTAFTRITEVLDVQMSGGEQQATSIQFADSEQETELATFINAQRITLTISDDATKAGYLALKAATESGAVTALKIATKTGTLLCYTGTVHLNESPTVTKNNVMSCACVFMIRGRVVRYAA